MKKKVSVSNALLVDVAKSSRLSKMGNKHTSFVGKANFTQKKQLPVNLKLEQSQALEQALQRVSDQISAILEAFPSNKKNTFFKLKYGVSIESLNTLSMKQVFSLLQMDTKIIAHFRLIEHYDASGKVIDFNKDD